MFKVVPYIQEGNEGFVHHMILYECYGNFTEEHFDEGVDCDNSPNMPYPKCRIYSMVTAWAVGGQVACQFRLIYTILLYHLITFLIY